MINDINIFQIGDWVKGESKNGMLIVGYIESVNQVQGTVKVTVVASDHVKSIGKIIEICNKVERLPFSVSKTEEELRGLIDLALQIRDEQWFMQLTEKLNSMKKNSYPNILLKTGYTRNEIRRNILSTE